MALELAEKRRSARKVPEARTSDQKMFGSQKTKKAETSSAFWSRSLLGAILGTATGAKTASLAKGSSAVVETS